MPTSKLVDPEKAALLYVQQYLAENGYVDALRALESQCGLVYDDEKMPEGSMLMQLVWNHTEGLVSQQLDDVAAAQAAEEEQLARGATQDYPNEESTVIQGVHGANITCISILSNHDLLVTGSGDGRLHLLQYNGTVQWVSELGPGGLLCVDVPQTSTSSSSHSQQESLLLAGSMNGTVHLVRLSDGSVHCSHKAHSKYVVRAVWAGSGDQSHTAMFVTASWDRSVGVHCWDAGSNVVTTVKQVSYPAAVHDVAVLPGTTTAIVAVRDTNYLRLLDLSDLEADEKRVNMNANGDDHVSFYAAHLSASPCGKYLLVSTDGSRLLVLGTSDWRQLRMLHGLRVAQFHQPCALWHRDSRHVFAAGADAQVKVYHIHTGKQELALAGHKINVRGLSYDPDSNILATCSYDKTVRLFRRA